MNRESYLNQLHTPDHITVSRRDAKRLCMLSDADLETLESVEQPNPYGQEDSYELYWLTDVVELAKSKHTIDELLANYEKHNSEKNSGTEAKRRIYGTVFPSLSEAACVHRWYSGPSSQSPEGKKSILQGLRSNIVIFGGKLVVFKMTGSMAIFADSMHSLADVCNYMYRYYSISNSLKHPDQNHPYGYAPLRHICADRSFVGLLLIGGCVPVFGGMYELAEAWHFAGVLPTPDPTMVLLSGAVLCFSMVMEGVAMRTAAAEMAERDSKTKVGVKKPTDIMMAATHLEAKAGVYGGLLGLFGVAATFITGNPLVEITCATMMGVMVSGVAVRLLGWSSTSLLGATLPVERVTKVIEMLQNDPIVVDVFDVKTQVLGTDTVRFKAEIHYNAEMITKKRRSLHHLPSEEAQLLYSEIKELAKKTPHEAEDWLMRNDAEFLIAFSMEVGRLRGMIHDELSEYTKVHVDLNVW